MGRFPFSTLNGNLPKRSYEIWKCPKISKKNPKISGKFPHFQKENSGNFRFFLLKFLDFFDFRKNIIFFKIIFRNDEKYFSSKFIFPWGYNPWSPRKTPLRDSPELSGDNCWWLFSGANLDNFGQLWQPKMLHISRIKQMPTMKFFYVQVHTLKKLWWNFQLNRRWWRFLLFKPFVPNLAWEHLLTIPG